jgi:hypothetical protein
MTAGVLDLNIEQGTTWERTVTWSAGEPAVPVNLTGYTARAQLRAIPSGDLVATLDATILSPASSGQVKLALSAAASTAISVPGRSSYKDSIRCAWDLELTDAAGRVTRLLNGYAYISPEVTR